MRLYYQDLFEIQELTISILLSTSLPLDPAVPLHLMLQSLSQFFEGQAELSQSKLTRLQDDLKGLECQLSSLAPSDISSKGTQRAVEAGKGRSAILKKVNGFSIS